MYMKTRLLTLVLATLAVPALAQQKPTAQFASQTNAPAVAQVEAGDWVCTVCNHLPKETTTDNVNFQYYIDKCYTIINKIKLKGKKAVKKQPANQTSLF